jgi:lysophospholipase L1-like esterase
MASSVPTSVPGRRKATLTPGKKTVFACTTCVLLIGAVEIGWRLVIGWHNHWLDHFREHPVLGWCLRENWTGHESWTGGFCRINEHGLRDDRSVGPKATGERRLLIVGDSITFGARVSTQQAYPAQLEEALTGVGVFWRVLNGGVTGYDPSQEADWLEEFGWPLQPDRIAIAFCANDGDPSNRAEEYHERRPTSTFAYWLTEHSILAYKLQRGLWTAEAHLGVASATLPVSKTGPHPALSGWPFIEHHYRRVDASARSRHVPVVLLIFPTLDRLRNGGDDEYSARLNELAHELHWDVIDLAGAFVEEREQLYLPGDPIHPNAAGYRRAARFSCEPLRAVLEGDRTDS